MMVKSLMFFMMLPLALILWRKSAAERGGPAQLRYLDIQIKADCIK